MMEVSKQWPEDQETPSFGKTTSESSNLLKFIECLGNDKQFTFLRSMALAKKLLKKWSLHIWENEEGRRKLQRLVKVKSADTAGTISASELSSSNGSPPPSIYDKKRKEYVVYFNPSKYTYTS